MTSDNFKESLKQQADIVRIVGDYVKLKKAGAQNFSGLCPFHSEKTPSFSVHAIRQFYHCFGCGASGDVFSFVQKIENITFPETVRLIAQKLGVPMPKVTFSSPAEAREAKVRTGLLEIHELASTFFQERLKRPEGAHAREYLKNRGLDDETIARFRIGYAPDSGFLLRDALREKFDEELLRESGLFSWKDSSQLSASSSQGKQVLRSDGDDNKEKGAKVAVTDGRELTTDSSRAEASSQRPAAFYSKFRNRVMFPIANDQGRVIAFTGRTLATDEKAGPKYFNSPKRRSIRSRGCCLTLISQGRNSQARLRDSRRGADGLHRGVRRRIHKRIRQLRNRIHRTPGKAARTLFEERGREIRS